MPIIHNFFRMNHASSCGWGFFSDTKLVNDFCWPFVIGAQIVLSYTMARS